MREAQTYTKLPYKSIPWCLGFLIIVCSIYRESNSRVIKNIWRVFHDFVTLFPTHHSCLVRLFLTSTWSPAWFVMTAWHHSCNFWLLITRAICPFFEFFPPDGLLASLCCSKLKTSAFYFQYCQQSDEITLQRCDSVVWKRNLPLNSNCESSHRWRQTIASESPSNEKKHPHFFLVVCVCANNFVVVA
jgi:hypothetical protein